MHILSVSQISFIVFIYKYGGGVSDDGKDIVTWSSVKGQLWPLFIEPWLKGETFVT